MRPVNQSTCRHIDWTQCSLPMRPRKPRPWSRLSGPRPALRGMKAMYDRPHRVCRVHHGEPPARGALRRRDERPPGPSMAASRARARGFHQALLGRPARLSRVSRPTMYLTIRTGWPARRCFRGARGKAGGAGSTGWMSVPSVPHRPSNPHWTVATILVTEVHLGEGRLGGQHCSTGARSCPIGLGSGSRQDGKSNCDGRTPYRFHFGQLDALAGALTGSGP